MAFDPDKYIAIAREKIDIFGMDAVFSLPFAGSAYDPLKCEAEAAFEEKTIRSVMLDIEDRDIGNGLVQAGDARLLVEGSALAAAPDSRATVRIKDDVWRIIHSSCVAPNGRPLLWKLLIRRS